jgi:hypothetical protein
MSRTWLTMFWQGGVSLLLGFLYCGLLFNPFLFILFYGISVFLIPPISFFLGFHAVWLGGEDRHWGRLVLLPCWATGFFLTGALLPFCLFTETNPFLGVAYVAMWTFPIAVIGGLVAAGIRRWQEPPKRFVLPPLT